MAKLKQRYPNSQIFPVVTGDDIAGYLADNSDEVVQLAVVGSADATQIAHIVRPQSHPLVPHGECSVLVVR